MAKKKHLKILKQGVKAWNAWRKENPDIEPDLRDAVLGAVALIRANLSGADLSGANLRRANLSRANLIGANLFEADLIEADLSGAVLAGADLIGANLSRANLGQALLFNTLFCRVALKGAKGLNKCRHVGPSIIDFQTLQLSGMLPVKFLRGCGMPDDLIEFLRSMLSKDHYSCFISYSHDDKDFAQRLHDYLQEKGIRCWLDEHQILPGDDVRDQIDRGIKLWDKVLLCCSKSSLDSYWVNSEIDKALKKEETLWREQGKRTLALIPLNLDGYLFKWESSRKSILTDRLAENLVGWKKNPEKLKRALERIEKALRADEGGREPPPESRL